MERYPDKYVFKTYHNIIISKFDKKATEISEKIIQIIENIYFGK